MGGDSELSGSQVSCGEAGLPGSWAKSGLGFRLLLPVENLNENGKRPSCILEPKRINISHPKRESRPGGGEENQLVQSFFY